MSNQVLIKRVNWLSNGQYFIQFYLLFPQRLSVIKILLTNFPIERVDSGQFTDHCLWFKQKYVKHAMHSNCIFLLFIESTSPLFLTWLTLYSIFTLTLCFNLSFEIQWKNYDNQELYWFRDFLGGNIGIRKMVNFGQLWMD